MADEEVTNTCFVVMPITTPPERLQDYDGNEHHFPDVLEALFIPAIEAAGYKAVPPQFEGSPVIQAAIIRNLIEADLVLCDMSALNPNAMFELGVRSALNKPVAMVRDHVTAKIPFDLGPVSALTYDGTLYGKHLDKGRKALADHLTATAAVGDHNELWRYFGIEQTGSKPPEGTQLDGIEAMLTTLLQRSPRPASQDGVDHEEFDMVAIDALLGIPGVLSAWQRGKYDFSVDFQSPADDKGRRYALRAFRDFESKFFPYSVQVVPVPAEEAQGD